MPDFSNSVILMLNCFAKLFNTFCTCTVGSSLNKIKGATTNTYLLDKLGIVSHNFVH